MFQLASTTEQGKRDVSFLKERGHPRLVLIELLSGLNFITSPSLENNFVFRFVGDSRFNRKENLAFVNNTFIENNFTGDTFMLKIFLM